MYSFRPLVAINLCTDGSPSRPHLTIFIQSGSAIPMQLYHLFFSWSWNLLLRAALPCPSTLPPCGQGVKKVQSCRPTPGSDAFVVCTISGGLHINICWMTNDISLPKVHSMGRSHPIPTSSPCHPLLLWSPRPCWDSAPSWSPLVFPMQLTWWTKRSLSNLSLRRLVSLVISRWSGLWRIYCALISHAGKLLSNFKPLTHQFRQGASPPLGRQGDSNLLEISQLWICLWNVL